MTTAKYQKQWRALHPGRQRIYARRWRRKHLKKATAISNSYYAKNVVKIRVRTRKSDLKIKREVLTHYSSKGRLCCSWHACSVSDLDMLSLDHTKNDGAEARRAGEGGGISLFRFLRKRGYPKGYQTLCHNHQWKKEILYRRAVGIK